MLVSGNDMIKNIIFIAVFSALSFISLDAHSYYFLIELKNGNVIETEKYWEEGKYIRFFVNSGSAGIPKRMISNIVKNDGILSAADFSYESESAEEDEAYEEFSRLDSRNQSDIIEDIKDRISVIESNIANLKTNKQTYINQKERYLRDKERAEERYEKIKNSPFMTSKDLKVRTELELSKKMDAEKKIEDVERRIQTTGKMLESQERMRERLQDELAQQKK